jgi:hypothetical protein
VLLATDEKATLQRFSAQSSGTQWLRVWLLAAACFGGSVASLEAYSRALGFRPSVTDSKDLWYFWRQRVYRADHKVVVLLGTSRVMADVSLASVHEALPDYSVVQLGLSGAKSPIGLLQDLIADRDFNGIVVSEMEAPLLEKARWRDHAENMLYRPHSLPDYMDVIARTRLNDFLASSRPHFALRSVVARWFDTGSEGPFPCHWTFAREAPFDFSENVDAGAYRSRRAESCEGRYLGRPVFRWESVLEEADQINAAIRDFKTRGGNVVFVRLPSTGTCWQLEETFHSKALNWDRLAASSGAICIHFRDFPSLREFDCPDNSHLDRRDAPRFTRALFGEISRYEAFADVLTSKDRQ